MFSPLNLYIVYVRSDCKPADVGTAFLFLTTYYYNKVMELKLPSWQDITVVVAAFALWRFLIYINRKSALSLNDLNGPPGGGFIEGQSVTRVSATYRMATKTIIARFVSRSSGFNVPYQAWSGLYATALGRLRRCRQNKRVGRMSEFITGCLN